MPSLTQVFAGSSSNGGEGCSLAGICEGYIHVSMNSRFYLVVAILMTHLTVSPYNACLVF